MPQSPAKAVSLVVRQVGSLGLPGVEQAIAEGLVRDTERICPYAKMARTGIACVVLLDA